MQRTCFSFLFPAIIWFTSLPLSGFGQSEITIQPRWKVGDERTVKSYSEGSMRMGELELSGLEAQSSYRWKVLEATEAGYRVQLTSLMQPEPPQDMQKFAINKDSLAQLDSLEAMQAVLEQIGQLAAQMQKSLQSSLTQQDMIIHVSPEGTVVDIEDFDAIAKAAIKSALHMMSDLMNAFGMEGEEAFEMPSEEELMEKVSEQKENFRQTVLNYFNYMNQCYTNTYHPDVPKSEEVIAHSFSTLPGQAVEAPAIQTTEVLENTKQRLTVSIRYEVDPETLRSLMESGEAVQNISGNERFRVTFDRKTGWILSFESTVEVEMDNAQFYSYEKHTMQ